MFILAEKPNVARDFADALSIPKKGYFWSDGRTEITCCKGHLWQEETPDFYDPRFKSWREIPCLPETFAYRPRAGAESQCGLVARLLAKHRHGDILIATDADREGEIIARECLIQAGIRDISRIKRFWVSEALTPEVIRKGIRDARPLSEYDALAASGFARQHADWLVGINFTRFLSVAAGVKLPVGRVQTAILSAVDGRCSAIENFRSRKYFEFEGRFFSPGDPDGFTALYTDGEGKTAFDNTDVLSRLNAAAGKTVSVLGDERTRKETPPPQLYNLTAAQKDAFKLFSFSASETLEIIQKLYDGLKCISYPRTPSRVMGSGNVGLCRNIFSALASADETFAAASVSADISPGNRRVFDDARLDAHHALIPLRPLPPGAGEREKQVYGMIAGRFRTAFSPPCVYERQTVSLSAAGFRFVVRGKKILDPGWTAFARPDDGDDDAYAQSLDGTDWNSLTLENVAAREKHTKPPKFFDEAGILSFMENPRDENAERKKLVGLGTSATRHTFLPKLLENGYVAFQGKRIVVTELGRKLLAAVRASAISSVADISETTAWEERLAENPARFERDIRSFVSAGVSAPLKIDASGGGGDGIPCPVCGRPLRRSEKNWYCSGYREGCGFTLWRTVCGTRLTDGDARRLCAGKTTAAKKFISKGGKEFKARLFLDGDKKTAFDFQKK